METATASVRPTDNNTNSTTNEIIDTYYYTNSTVKFCTGVDENYNAIGANTSFNISPSLGGYVYVLVKNNNQALKTNKLYVDIYKGGDYSEFVETKTFDITSNWSSFNFPYTFYRDGQYMFKVYNSNSIFINAGYVSVGYN